MRFHAQNLTDGRLPMWREGRCWWGRFHAEWSVFRRPRLGVSFEKGGHVSDGTGVQLHVALLLFSVYLSFDTARLFGRPYRPLEDRRLGVSWHDGGLWFDLWRSDDDWVRDRPWHRNVAHLPVVEWIVGRNRYECTKGESFEVLIPMPEGCYRATFTPMKQSWRNRFRTRRREGWDIRIPGGIPFEGKGENSWDCGGDGLWGTGSEARTEAEAVGGVVGSVLRSRERYGETTRTKGVRVMAADATAGGR